MPSVHNLGSVFILININVININIFSGEKYLVGLELEPAQHRQARYTIYNYLGIKKQLR
jgi:hypothetical protein